VGIVEMAITANILRKGLYFEETAEFLPQEATLLGLL